MNVLIYFKKYNLKPSGGPAGYLYNLSTKLPSYFHFLSVNNNVKKHNFKKNIYRILPACVRKSVHDINWRNKAKKYLLKKEQVSVNFNEYDAIHFHSTFDLYKVRKELENYEGKVILTSHTPKVPYKEIIEDWISKKEYFKHKKIYDELEVIDKYAFSRADALIFPCEEAEEPYFNTWDWYKLNKDSLIQKKYYVPTGVCKVKTTKTRDEIRKKYNIPLNAFVICYVGRHIEVKGYDTLIKLFNEICSNDNVYFLICGKINDLIPYPKSTRWIEVGWTNEPMNLVNSSDLLLCPNKETYFDLTILEAMSIGACMILSNTGGNKYIQKISNGIIKTYSSFQDLLKKINEQIAIVNDAYYPNLKAHVEEIYESYFSVDVFAKKYVDVVRDILNDKC